MQDEEYDQANKASFQEEDEAKAGGEKEVVTYGSFVKDLERENNKNQSPEKKNIESKLSKNDLEPFF